MGDLFVFSGEGRRRARRNWRLLSPYQFVLFAMSSSTGFHFRCSACTKVMAVTRQLDWQIGRCSWQRREGGQDRHIKRVSTEVQMRPTRSYSGQHVVEGVVHRGLLFRVERAT